MAIGAPTLGPKPPEVTRPIGSPDGADDFGAFARGRAPSEPDAHPAARRPVGERRLNARRAGKAAFDAPPLLDRPGEARLDRIDRLVEFVAVEAEARFEPQRIARAEADRLDFAFASRRRAKASASSAGSEISKPSSPV